MFSPLKSMTIVRKTNRIPEGMIPIIKAFYFSKGHTTGSSKSCYTLQKMAKGKKCMHNILEGY